MLFTALENKFGVNPVTVIVFPAIALVEQDQAQFLHAFDTSAVFGSAAFSASAATATEMTHDDNNTSKVRLICFMLPSTVDGSWLSDGTPAATSWRQPLYFSRFAASLAHLVPGYFSMICFSMARALSRSPALA